jgi:4-oxalocrotonate tautomerase
MPHFIVKLFPGKSDEQKKALTAKIVEATKETLEVGEDVISLNFVEVTPDDWEEKVAKPDIIPNKDSLYKVPDYI